MLTELTDCARARSSKTLKHLRKTLPLEQEIQPSEHLALGLGLYERLYGQNIEGTTAGELLSRVETGATALVNAMAAELVHRGESIPEAIRRAVLRRALEPGPGRLPALPWNPMACAEAFLLHLLLLWPGVRVPPWETTWTQGAAMVHGDDGIRQMAEAAQREFERIHDEGWYKIQEKKGWGRVACWAPLLYLAERELEQDRRRPICAVPANVEHHDLVSGWKDAPWQGKPERECFADDEEERIALFTHERIQLQLPFKELQNELVRVMREVHQAEGLRHWAAFLTLLSTDGGRQQWVRWTLDRHMEIMCYGKHTREDREARARIAKLVELWTLWELARVDRHGLFRERKPLLHVGTKFDKRVGSKWSLDGMELQINPLIYNGVRQSNGELGRNWCSVPAELATIDHLRYPAALSLGLLFPIWWRWDAGKQLVRKAGTLLEQAGLPATRKTFLHAPGRTWQALEHSLEELQRIDEVGNWEWLDNERELESRILIEPSNMVADRLLRGVEPVEPPIDTTPRTGRELRAWREAHGWTQVELAGRIGVVVRTLSAAETHPDSALTPRLVGKIRTRKQR